MSLSGSLRLRNRLSFGDRHVAHVPAITLGRSSSTQPRRFVFARCILLCVMGGLTTGYSLAILGCLVTMDTFIEFLSEKLYDKTLLAVTSNFCPYVDVWPYTYYATLPVGVIFGLISGLLWSRSVRGRQHPRISTMVAAILVCIGSFGFTFVTNIIASGAMCFIIGVGIGLTQEAIPVIPLRVVRDRRNVMEMTFEFSKLLGALLCYKVCSLVVWKFQEYWYVVAYVLAGTSVLFLVASLVIGDIRDMNQIEDRSIVDVYREQPRLLKKKLIHAVIPQLFGVSSRLFHGPLILESMGMWGGNSYLAVLIGGAISFVSTAFCMYCVIPRLGRRKAILYSLPCSLAFEIGSLVVFAKWSTEDHSLKGVPLGVLTAFFLGMCLISPMYSGPHGWSSDVYRPEAERVGRAMETIASTVASLASQLAIPIAICAVKKLFFLFPIITSVFWFVFVFLMVV